MLSMGEQVEAGSHPVQLQCHQVIVLMSLSKACSTEPFIIKPSKLLCHEQTYCFACLVVCNASVSVLTQHTVKL